MKESYEENAGMAKPFPGHKQRKKGYNELPKNFHYRLNNIISIARDLDRARTQREAQNKQFTVIQNQDLKGLTVLLLSYCNDIFDIFSTVLHSGNILEITSMVYEERLVSQMSKDILDDIYKKIGYTRK